MEKIYPYAVSKIKAKEVNLLTKHELDNLAEEINIERIKTVLFNKKYNFEKINKIQDFEIVLKDESEKLYKDINEALEEKEIVRFLNIKNDYYNTKLILKAKLGNKEYKNYLIDGGEIQIDDIIESIEFEKYSILPKNLEDAVKEALIKYEEIKNMFIIDATIDKYLYLELEKISKKINNEFIIKYLKKLIDINNIKSYFRIKKIFNNYKIFKYVFLEKGEISLSTFEKNFNQDEVNSNLKNTSYREIYEKAIIDYDNLDKFCDNYLMKYMKEAKLKALTVEPIIAYFYAKETEIKNVRIILTGKLNKINNEIIKERLRESYV